MDPSTSTVVLQMPWDAGAGSPLPTPGHPAACVPSAGRLRVLEHGAGQKYASGDNAGPASCHVHLWPALRLPAASSSCPQRQAKSPHGACAGNCGETEGMRLTGFLLE